MMKSSRLEDNRIKLCDFGVAAYCTDNEMLTERIGTLHYSAPEIVLGKAYNKGVDVWALGVTLYSLLSGQLPFHDRNVRMEIDKICSQTYGYDDVAWVLYSSTATTNRQYI